jgi:hypothetical protein
VNDASFYVERAPLRVRTISCDMASSRAAARAAAVPRIRHTRGASRTISRIAPTRTFPKVEPPHPRRDAAHMLTRTETRGGEEERGVKDADGGRMNSTFGLWGYTCVLHEGIDAWVAGALVTRRS